MKVLISTNQLKLVIRSLFTYHPQVMIYKGIIFLIEQWIRLQKIVIHMSYRSK